jgi:hypothetical protein
VAETRSVVSGVTGRACRVLRSHGFGETLAKKRSDFADWLAAIRGVIYQRALPLATRRLTIASCGDHVAVAGAALLARQRALSPSAAAQLLSGAPLTLPGP